MFNRLGYSTLALLPAHVRSPRETEGSGVEVRQSAAEISPRQRFVTEKLVLVHIPHLPTILACFRVEDFVNHCEVVNSEQFLRTWYD